MEEKLNTCLWHVHLPYVELKKGLFEHGRKYFPTFSTVYFSCRGIAT